MKQSRRSHASKSPTTRARACLLHLAHSPGVCPMLTPPPPWPALETLAAWLLTCPASACELCWGAAVTHCLHVPRLACCSAILPCHAMQIAQLCDQAERIFQMEPSVLKLRGAWVAAGAYAGRGRAVLRATCCAGDSRAALFEQMALRPRLLHLLAQFHSVHPLTGQPMLTRIPPPIPPPSRCSPHQDFWGPARPVWRPHAAV